MMIAMVDTQITSSGKPLHGIYINHLSSQSSSLLNAKASRRAASSHSSRARLSIFRDSQAGMLNSRRTYAQVSRPEGKA